MHLRATHPGALLLFLALNLALAGTASAVIVGDSAPDFRLVGLDGMSYSLADLDGKVVVLYFFGHNADLCRQTAGEVDGLYQQYQSQGLEVFGIDCWDGTADQNQEFRDASGATYPVLLGGSSTASAYDLPYHSVVVIDTEGRVAYVSAGPDPGAFDSGTVEDAIVRSLNHANSTRDATWGAIKTLYGRKLLAGLE